MTTQTIAEESIDESHCPSRGCQYCGQRDRLYTIASPSGHSSWICADCWQPMAVAAKQRRYAPQMPNARFDLALSMAQVHSSFQV